MSEIVCLRLQRGDDLLECITDAAKHYDIACGAIVSAVGCVSYARLRDAGGECIREINEPCEIVSITGTVGRIRSHVHVSLSKEDLSVVGGHLVEGCIVNTTCELIILCTDKYRIISEYDGETGYDEAVFVEVD